MKSGTEEGVLTLVKLEKIPIQVSNNFLFWRKFTLTSTRDLGAGHGFMLVSQIALYVLKFHMVCHRFCPQALAEALKVNKTLTEIDLRDNDIGKEGAKAWCLGRRSVAPGLGMGVEQLWSLRIFGKLGDDWLWQLC